MNREVAVHFVSMFKVDNTFDIEKMLKDLNTDEEYKGINDLETVYNWLNRNGFVDYICDVNDALLLKSVLDTDQFKFNLSQVAEVWEEFSDEYYNASWIGVSSNISTDDSLIEKLKHIAHNNEFLNSEGNLFTY